LYRYSLVWSITGIFQIRRMSVLVIRRLDRKAARKLRAKRMDMAAAKDEAKGGDTTKKSRKKKKKKSADGGSSAESGSSSGSGSGSGGDSDDEDAARARVRRMQEREVGLYYKLNPVETHSLKAAW
jgi:uncharacterized membrane protein YgcG